MADETTREKNQAAAARQKAVREERMHEERSGHFAGLTKRNREYLFKIEKELTAQGYPAEKRTAAIEQMKNELQQRQREGMTAAKLYGPIKQHAQEIIAGPKKEPQPQKFWEAALDNGLIMFMMFCVMYALIEAFGGKKAVGTNGGILTIVIISVISGCGLGYFYQMMTPVNGKRPKIKWVRTILLLVVLMAVWMVAYGFVAQIGGPLNITMPWFVYVILGVLGWGARYVLKNYFHLNFGRAFGRN